MDDQGNSAYKIILGRDYLQKLGMDVKFSLREEEWNDHVIPFCPHLTSIQIKFIEQTSLVVSLLANNALTCIDIKPSGYHTQSTPEQIANKQLHLPAPVHRTALVLLATRLLHKHQELYSHTLGKYPNQKVNLHLIPVAKPIHYKPLSVPIKNLAQLKQEIKTQLELDVIEPVLTSLWAFPTFLFPKKDGIAWFVSDFRILNQLLQEEQHSLPIILEILTCRTRFTFVTIFDLTSQFYHCFEVDSESR
jgi:hypothetical protein